MVHNDWRHSWVIIERTTSLQLFQAACKQWASWYCCRRNHFDQNNEAPVQLLDSRIIHKCNDRISSFALRRLAPPIFDRFYSLCRLFKNAWLWRRLWWNQWSQRCYFHCNQLMLLGLQLLLMHSFVEVWIWIPNQSQWAIEFGLACDFKYHWTPATATEIKAVRLLYSCICTIWKRAVKKPFHWDFRVWWLRWWWS